jgi:hypothetical protein
MHGSFSQDRDAAPGRRRPHPRRVRVAESVYQRVDRESGKPVAGKYEFTYRDATGRQVWQTAKGDSKPTQRPSGPSCSRACTWANGSSAPR